MSIRRLPFALCFPLLVAACSNGGETFESEAGDEIEDAPEVEASDPLENPSLTDLIRRTHFAFRENARGISASHSSHLVEVYGTRIELTPFFPRIPDPSGETPGTPAIPGAAIGLETVDISRGDVDLLDDPGAPELEQDGSVTIPRGPTDEHLDNTEVGVEQSWTLHQAPGGDGDLVVRIEVDGTQGYVTTTDSGLHFEDPISGLGVSYGVATWIDAEGDETTVMPSFEDGHIVIRIPDEVVDASAFPVLLDPVISAENGIDNPVLAGAAGIQRDPAVAYGDNQYLVVWMDARLDANSSAIYGARLSASGQILDPNGILISAFGGTLGARSVDVTWDGENYFVGWSRGSSVNTQRVAPSGTLVGAPVLAGTSSFFSSVEVAVASNGERNYVAYSSAWTTMVAAFETDGALAYSSSGVMLGDETQRPVDIACGSDGSCLVVSEYGSSVQFARFNDAAASSVEGSIPDSGNPRVAHDGDDFVVVSDDWTAGDPTLRASVVTQAGVVEAPVIRSNVYGARGLSCASGQCVALVGNAALGFEPHQGWTWVAGLDTPAGREADSIVTNGTDYLVVGWGYNYETRDEVWAQRVASEGSTSGVRIVSTTTTNSQVQPDVSCGATSCLVVWQDDRVDTLQIRGALTTKTGSPLTGSTLGLGCDAGGCDARHPSVAYAAGRFVTAYECTFAGSYQTVCATSVQDNGTIVYHGAPSVGTDLRRPRLAAGAGGELLAVAQRGVDFGSGDIVGVLVDAAAGPVSEILITEAVDDQLAPAVTFDGTNYVVAWEDWRRGPAFGPDVMAARVNASGTVLDPQGFNVSVRNSAEARPAIASDGAGSVVVTWEDNRGGSWDIYGARVSAGSVTDANGISFGTPGTSQQRRPAMAWNGTSYQVVWEDDRNGNGEIYGRQITTGGAMSGGAFGVVTSTTAATAPELAGDGAGGSLLVYQRYVPALAQTRVRAKAITP